MKFLRSLAALLLFMLAAAVHAEYLEGVEYAVINPPQPVDTGAKIEVREIFMYSCPHCFRFEPALAKWLKTKPANVQFVRTPAIFRPTSEPQARAFYALEALHAPESVHNAVFEAIHVQQRPLNDEASLAKFVAEKGVNEEQFRRAYHSFSVDAEVKQAMSRVPAYGVDSVPTMIVDGKYRTNGTMAGSNELMLKVVDYLVQKSAQERKKTSAPAKAKK